MADPRELNLTPIEPSRVPEMEPRPRFDTIIVFGQGPVKEIKLASDLGENERADWDRFIQNPRGELEPDFYVIDGEDLSDEEKSQFQHLGRFALKRLGRLNALAAGYALVTGQTKELILSGGRTMTKAKRDEFREKFEKSMNPDELVEYARLPKAVQEMRLNDYVRDIVGWPSEAQLMKDVIRRRFFPEFRNKFLREHSDLGDLSEEEIDKLVNEEFDRVVKVEDEAGNTLENFFKTIDKYEDIRTGKKRIGYLSVSHQLPRIALIANMLTMNTGNEDEIASQLELEQRARERTKKAYEAMMQKPLPEMTKYAGSELDLVRGMEDPKSFKFWGGYLGYIKDPELFYKVLKRTLKSPEWVQAVRGLFAEINQKGFSFDDFEHGDIIRLIRRNPQEFEEFRQKLLVYTLFPEQGGKREKLSIPEIKK